jgi:FkbH-like protein
MNDQISNNEIAHARVAIAATFVAEPLLPALRYALDTAGLGLDVRFAAYNQVFQELLSQSSLLATNAGGIDVVLVRIEDFIRDAESDEAACALINRIVPELCGALSQHARRAQAPTIFATLPVSPSARRTLLVELEAANAALIAHARALAGVVLLSREDIDLVSTREPYDNVSDELAHIPFTDEYFAAIAVAVARKIHALRVPPHKVLVLDCDETLWRGVVGEDGVDGIAVSPGLARLQRFAVQVQGQGALICLVSKNAERDVLEVFDNRPDMILKLDHIVAHRINWDSKPRNIASLARALNLGLDSFVFIDDNPVECALMRTELPQVVTLQLPPESEIDSFLSHLWTFDKVAVTVEDSRRTAMYRENTARQEFEESATDIAAFIASLGVVVDMDPPAEHEWARLAQLTQRTNQFNFTTVRRTEPEIRALASAGYFVNQIKVLDRFGDYGLVGLVIASAVEDTLVVDTFLLSCRVLGRGVEHTVLRRLGEVAKDRGLHCVDLPYIGTSKNEPAHAFIESVAVSFRTEKGPLIIYRLPAEAVCAIAHRPGHDPAAVVEARKADERKGAASSLSRAAEQRSERYAVIGHELATDVRVLEALRSKATRRRQVGAAPVPASTDTERDLLRLWQELLGIDGLGVEDDYFASGGTSLIAARLFAEIARRFGVRLPLTTILELPTVRALAPRLELQGTSELGALIELKSGGPRNLFLVHDGDGETLLYMNLARRTPEDLAVWGIEPNRLPGIPLAHAAIEDMATFYLKEIRKKQPHGPYLLGGMCAGGVIAYEMAVQLENVNEAVDLVALLDAAAPRAAKKPGRLAKERLGRLRGAIEQARRGGYGPMKKAGLVIGVVSQKLTNALIWEVLQRGKRWSANMRLRLLGNVVRQKGNWPWFVPELSVRQIYDTAESRYFPNLLSKAPTVLVRARRGEADDTPYKEIYAEETLDWRYLARNLTVVDVDGGHSSMLQQHCVESLADALRPYVTSKKSAVAPGPDAAAIATKQLHEIASSAARCE